MKMKKRIRKKHQLNNRNLPIVVNTPIYGFKFFYLPDKGKRWRRLRKLKYEEVCRYARKEQLNWWK